MSRSCIRVVIALALVSLITGCRRPGEEVMEIGSPTNWHTCPPPATWPAADSKTVGPAGDTLRSGDNMLIIPPNAVNANRTFTLSVIENERVGVEVTMSNQGKLRELATLVVAERCPLPAGDWFLWRIRPSLENPSQSQKLRPRAEQGRARVQIDTTSAFMIAN